MFALALLLLAADPDQLSGMPRGGDAPAAAAHSGQRQTLGKVSALIHSETFKRPLEDTVQTFRVDYTASLKWSTIKDKACGLFGCHPACNLTFRTKVLSRQIWWLPPGRPPIMAEDAPAEREYPAGTLHYNRDCNALSLEEINRAGAEHLRPYQFADEMIKDQEMRDKAADNYLLLYPPISAPQ